MSETEGRDLKEILFKAATGVIGTALMFFVARLYQTIDAQSLAIAALRERDVATVGEIAVIQARLNGIDSAFLVRLEGTNTRLMSIEQRLDRVQHSLESLQDLLYKKQLTP